MFRREPGDTGFAVADGLIALTLVSLLVAVVVNAIRAGITSSRLGAERRVAAAEAEYRLLTEWPKLDAPGVKTGRSSPEGGWSVSARLVQASDPGPALCEVTSAITSGHPSRHYALQVYQFCRGGPPR